LQKQKQNGSLIRTVRQRLWSHPTCWRYIN